MERTMESDLKFRGTSTHTTDEKGRIVLPTRFRGVVEASGHNEVVVSQMDRSLVGYTLQGWQVVEEKIMNMPVENNTFRQLRRFFLAAAQPCEYTRQGRVLIPSGLRDLVGIGLKQEIVLVGMFDHFEIWGRQEYDREKGNFQETIAAGHTGPEFAKIGL